MQYKHGIYEAMSEDRPEGVRVEITAPTQEQIENRQSAREALIVEVTRAKASGSIIPRIFSPVEALIFGGPTDAEHVGHIDVEREARAGMEGLLEPVFLVGALRNSDGTYAIGEREKDIIAVNECRAVVGNVVGTLPIFDTRSQITLDMRGYMPSVAIASIDPETGLGPSEWPVGLDNKGVLSTDPELLGMLKVKAVNVGRTLYAAGESNRAEKNWFAERFQLDDAITDGHRVLRYVSAAPTPAQ